MRFSGLVTPGINAHNVRQNRITEKYQQSQDIKNLNRDQKN